MKSGANNGIIDDLLGLQPTLPNRRSIPYQVPCVRAGFSFSVSGGEW